jgi:hypothetical protein
MSEHSIEHPSAEELLWLSSGEGSGDRRAALLEHLDKCAECSKAAREMRAQWEQYLFFHEQVLKPALPDPPRPWDDLAIAPAVEHKWRRPVRWGAIAAGVVVCLAVAQRFRQPPAVSAAELLNKAVSAETRRPSRARIQIRTRNRNLIRPALVSGGSTARYTAAERELRAKFESAHYGWDDPLSARSFAAWRNQLPEKRDEVTQVAANGAIEAHFQIRTITGSGDLKQVSLSLRKVDLHPFAEQLQFSDETVDITEAPEALPILEPPASDIAAVPATIAGQPDHSLLKPAGPGNELHAVAALHEIGADLGEPIEVRRDANRVVVTGTGLDAARREQVREAMSKVPGTIVEFGEVAEAAPRPGGRSAVEELANRVVETSDGCMARAFALRSLAVRFPPAVESQLQPADRSLLASLRLDHIQVLSDSVKQLVLLLRPASGNVEADSGRSAPEAPRNWQTAAQSVLDATRRLDQLLNRAFAGSDGTPAPAAHEALREVQRQIAAYEKADPKK